MEMSMDTIGVEVSGHNATEIIEQIQRLEDLGVKAAWATSGGDSDPITLLAVAAMQTESILLGTSIVPTWPRHPITIAQQANVLANLAPGRFRLGIGPSHYSEMYEPFRFNFRKPLTNLREYLRIVKPLIQKGSVDFDGEQSHAHVAAADAFPDLPFGQVLAEFAPDLRVHSEGAGGMRAEWSLTDLLREPFLSPRADEERRHG